MSRIILIAHFQYLARFYTKQGHGFRYSQCQYCVQRIRLSYNESMQVDSSWMKIYTSNRDYLAALAAANQKNINVEVNDDCEPI